MNNFSAMIKRFYFTVLIVALGLFVRSAAAETDPVLERYITLALTQNPSLAAARSGAEAAGEQIPQAGALPDPMLGFGVKDIDLADGPFHSGGMTQRWISFEQAFPFPGMRGAMRDAARSEQSEMAAMADHTAVMLTADIKEMYYMWAYLRGAIELVNSNKALSRQMADLAATMIKVGRGAQSDLLRAQTQFAQFDIELAELEQLQRSAIADINICCAIPPDAQTTPPLPLEYHPIAVPYDTLWAMIQRAAPEVRASQARVQMADFEITAARKGAYPMFMLGGEYMRRGSGEMAENMVGVMGGVTLPLYWKSSQGPRIQQKKIEHRRAVEDHENTVNLLHFQLTDLAAKTQSLETQIAAYETSLIPQAQQTFDAARSAYATGKVDFMTVLDSQMMLLDMRRHRLMKIADYYGAWAMLEALTGERIW